MPVLIALQLGKGNACSTKRPTPPPFHMKDPRYIWSNTYIRNYTKVQCKTPSVLSRRSTLIVS